MPFSEKTNSQIVPGKAGTIDPRELSVLRMKDGKNKPCEVIKDGSVFDYVGIGWIEVRRATQDDADTYPVVVYPENPVEHRATI